MLQALREARERRTRCSWFGLARSRSSRRSAANRRPGARRRHRARAAAARRARRTRIGSCRSRTSCRGASGERRSARARRSRSSRHDTTDPGGAARGVPARGLAAASDMGTIGGNLLQSTRCWYWRLQFPCRLHGGDVCHARAGQHREHAIFANDFCASAHPSDPAAALLALGARAAHDRRELPVDLALSPPDGGRPAA